MAKRHFNGFWISSGDGIILAFVGTSELLDSVVAAVRQEYATVYVDCQDFCGSAKAATWLVTEDSDLGVSIWKRLDQEDADRRASGLLLVEPLAFTEVLHTPFSGQQQKVG